MRWTSWQASSCPTGRTPQHLGLGEPRRKCSRGVPRVHIKCGACWRININCVRKFEAEWKPRKGGCLGEEHVQGGCGCAWQSCPIALCRLPRKTCCSFRTAALPCRRRASGLERHVLLRSAPHKYRKQLYAPGKTCCSSRDSSAAMPAPREWTQNTF